MAKLDKTFTPIETHEVVWENCAYDGIENGTEKIDLNKVSKTFFFEARRFSLGNVEKVFFRDGRQKAGIRNACERFVSCKYSDRDGAWREKHAS